MLPCARGCVGKKIKALPAACADSFTNEPLLFLYPKWFRDATRHAYRTKRGSNCEATRVPFSDDQSAPTSVEENDKCTSPSILPKPPAISKTVDVHASTSQTKQNHDASIPWLPFSSSDVAEHWKGFDGNAKPAPKRKTAGFKHATTQFQVPPPGHKPHRNYNPRNINSMELAEKLASLPPPTPGNSFTFTVSASFLKWHTGTLGENMWRHHDGSGCMIHVIAPLTPEDEKRSVVCTGTVRAREIAIRHLKDLEANYLEFGEHQTSSDIGAETSLLPKQHLRVDERVKPTIWNLKTFSDQVYNIVNGRDLKSVERVLYPGYNESYHNSVAIMLTELFADPKLYRFHSSFALRMALEFCSTHTDIAFAARNIWTSSKEAGIIPDIECFNFEIGRCYRVGNRGGISRLIDEMEECHIRPNIKTWGLFFRSLQLSSERNQFLQLPGMPKATHDKFWRELVVQTLVDTTFKPSDEKPNRVASFSSHMDKTFKDGWVTAPVIQNMIVACTKAEAFNTMSDVLQLAAQHSVELDFGSSNALFEAVVKTQWFDDVLVLLRLQSLPINHLLQQKQIEFIFLEAWKQRLANTARVLWHFAASHGSIRHSMLLQIEKEIVRNKHSSLEENVPTNAIIAALVIGVGESATLKRPSCQFSAKEMDLAHVLESLSKWTPNGEARHNQLQLMHLLLERDLRAWQRFKPLEYSTLLNLLDQAYQTDIAWRDQDMVSRRTLPDLLKQAVKIDLEPLEASGDLVRSANLIAEPVSKQELTTPVSEESIRHNDDIQDMQSSRSPAQREYKNAHTERQQSLDFGDSLNMRSSTALPVTMSTTLTTAGWSFIDDLLHHLGLIRRE